jgi:hypothetical protein
MASDLSRGLLAHPACAVAPLGAPLRKLRGYGPPSAYRPARRGGMLDKNVSRGGAPLPAPSPVTPPVRCAPVLRSATAYPQSGGLPLRPYRSRPSLNLHRARPRCRLAAGLGRFGRAEAAAVGSGRFAPGGRVRMARRSHVDRCSPPFGGGALWRGPHPLTVGLVGLHAGRRSGSLRYARGRRRASHCDGARCACVRRRARARPRPVSLRLRSPSARPSLRPRAGVPPFPALPGLRASRRCAAPPYATDCSRFATRRPPGSQARRFAPPRPSRDRMPALAGGLWQAAFVRLRRYPFHRRGSVSG